MEQFLNMNSGLTETEHIVFTEKESSPFHSMILLYYVEEMSFRTLKDNAVHHLHQKKSEEKDTITSRNSCTFLYHSFSSLLK